MSLPLAARQQLCQRHPLAGVVVAEGCAEAAQVAQLGLCSLPLHELAALLPQLLQCWQDVLLQQLQGKSGLSRSLQTGRLGVRSSPLEQRQLVMRPQPPSGELKCQRSDVA